MTYEEALASVLEAIGHDEPDENDLEDAMELYTFGHIE